MFKSGFFLGIKRKTLDLSQIKKVYENLVWDPQDDDLPAGKEILDDVIPSDWMM